MDIDTRQQLNSRLSYISQGGVVNQPPVSKTPVNGFQTMETMGDMSCHEIKIPINPDTERGVSKSIFYGTQRIANLNHEIQRYSNDKIQYTLQQSIAGNHNELSKTQTVGKSSVATHRTDASSRQGITTNSASNHG